MPGFLDRSCPSHFTDHLPLGYLGFPSLVSVWNDLVLALQRLFGELSDRDRRANEIVDLIDSETPLDGEDRCQMANELRELFFPKPKNRYGITNSGYDSLADVMMAAFGYDLWAEMMKGANKGS
jgi:hypothetical protein